VAYDVHILLGRILKADGFDGSIIIKLEEAFREKIPEMESVLLQNGAMPTETCRAILSYKGVLIKKHLLEGVKKGAFDEAEATKRFEEWMKQNDAKVESKKSGLEKSKDDEVVKKLAVEKKVNEARAAKLVKKQADLAAKAEAADKAEAVAAEQAPVTETPEAAVDTEAPVAPESPAAPEAPETPAADEAPETAAEEKPQE